MIIRAIKILGEASTIVSAAKIGYDVYQTGSAAFKTYKAVKHVKSGTSGVLGEVKKALKRKP